MAIKKNKTTKTYFFNLIPIFMWEGTEGALQKIRPIIWYEKKNDAASFTFSLMYNWVCFHLTMAANITFIKKTLFSHYLITFVANILKM